MGTRAWQGIACEAQEVRANSIPKEWMLKTPVPETVMNVMDILYNCGIMSKEELDLTDKDATELLELLASRKVKSYDVTLAFCKRAAIAQQLVRIYSHVR
jgi:amidase